MASLHARLAILSCVACSACGSDGSSAGSDDAGAAGEAASGGAPDASAGGTPGVGGAAGTGAGGGPSDASSGGGATGGAPAAGGSDAGGCNDTFASWAGGADYYAAWSNGPPSDTSFFPIAVWLQSPSNASQYAAIGVNLFIGLWDGPTETQLTDLAAATMPALSDQNDVGLSSDNASWLWGWTQGDEPDNAQANGSGGYDPCIDPSVIQGIYADFVAADPTRPVYLNLGRGVAVENWVGRGTCTGQVADYPEYARGADIVSFDVYPVNSDDEARGNLWYVASGVERLREAVSDKKPVWTWIETTDFGNTNGAPTPGQIRAEVWMAIIHGAMGVGYFAHVFAPTFIEAGLLANTESRDAVAEIDAQIQSLAPVLNTPPVADGVVVDSSAGIEVATLVKRHQGATYVFAVSMRDQPTTATFQPTCVVDGAVVDVLGESRQLAVDGGAFVDEFDGYAVHLYEIR